MARRERTGRSSSRPCNSRPPARQRRTSARVSTGGKAQKTSLPAPCTGGKSQKTSLPAPCTGGKSQKTSLPTFCTGGKSQKTSLPAPCTGGKAKKTSLPALCTGGKAKKTSLPTLCTGGNLPLRTQARPLCPVRQKERATSSRSSRQPGIRFRSRRMGAS